VVFSWQRRSVDCRKDTSNPAIFDEVASTLTLCSVQLALASTEKYLSLEKSNKLPVIYEKTYQSKCVTVQEGVMSPTDYVSCRIVTRILVKTNEKFVLFVIWSGNGKQKFDLKMYLNLKMKFEGYLPKMFSRCELKEIKNNLIVFLEPEYVFYQLNYPYLLKPITMVRISCHRLVENNVFEYVTSISMMKEMCLGQAMSSYLAFVDGFPVTVSSGNMLQKVKQVFILEIFSLFKICCTCQVTQFPRSNSYARLRNSSCLVLVDSDFSTCIVSSLQKLKIDAHHAISYGLERKMKITNCGSLNKSDQAPVTKEKVIEKQKEKCAQYLNNLSDRVSS